MPSSSGLLSNSASAALSNDPDAHARRHRIEREQNKLAVPPLILQGIRALTAFEGLGLFLLGIFGLRLGFSRFGHDDGIATVWESVMLMLFAVLVIMAELRVPKRVLREFLFLRSYFGRGMMLIFLGSSIIIMVRGYESAVAIGSIALACGGIQIIISCPCFSARLPRSPEEITAAALAPDSSSSSAAVGGYEPIDSNPFV